MTTRTLRVTNDHDQTIELQYDGEAISFAGKGAAALPSKKKKNME